jgi:hypothetical protein
MTKAGGLMTAVAEDLLLKNRGDPKRHRQKQSMSGETKAGVNNDCQKHCSKTVQYLFQIG